MEKPVELKDGVYWIGAIDWNVREFHGYTTTRGSTYNAYLVKGEKTALVDTVKAGFFPEMLSRIESIVDPAEIDYLIVNHVEMDHSGAIPLFMERVPKCSIDCHRQWDQSLGASLSPGFAHTKSEDR